MIKQGANKRRLLILSSIKKSFNRHKDIYSKIEEQFDTFSKLIF